MNRIKDISDMPVRIEWDLVQPTVGTFHLSGSVKSFVETYRNIHTLGINRSLELAKLAVFIYQRILAMNLSPDEQLRIFETIWRGLGDLTYSGVDRWETPTDMALSLCYTLLKREEIGREESAKIALLFLPTDDVSDWNAWREAWRKRVDRWAKAHKLSPIGRARQRKQLK